MDMDSIRAEIERERLEVEADAEHLPGRWYPADNPPARNVYGIALCVSGKTGNEEYHHGILLDSCNCYEDGKFYPLGSIHDVLTVHGYFIIPESPRLTEGELFK